MNIKIVCPNLCCRKVLSVPSNLRGESVRCKFCQTMIRIPEKEAAPVATVKK